ncbi:hypothetical protein JW964_04895 [candidate division KSB1 bacterium]|nr:hypothetical protein [candidate division KSB1 bacterium]
MFKSLFFSMMVVCLLMSGTSLIAQEKVTTSPEVLALAEYTLKDSTQAEAFEKAMNDFIRIYMESFPGIKCEMYKGDRGPGLGKYMVVFYFDTKARRDFYWPQRGKMGDVYRANWNKPEIQEKWKNVAQYFNYNWLGDFIIVK